MHVDTPCGTTQTAIASSWYASPKLQIPGIFIVQQGRNVLLKLMLLTNSPVFKALFDLPQPNSEPSEGADDSSPIILNGVSLTDMEAFLTLLYLP